MSIVRSGDDPTAPDPLTLPLADFTACATMCDALLNMDRAANRLRAFANVTGCKRAAAFAEKQAVEVAALESLMRAKLAELQGVQSIGPLLAPNLAIGRR